MSVKFYNTDDFTTLRQEGGRYVDKTEFLDKFINLSDDNLYRPSTQVSLFTRPRRFGKSLFMTMLASFFDITKDSRALFSGLKVTDNAKLCEQWMNQYPVIYLTFKDVDGLDFATAKNELRSRISDAYDRHDYVLDSEKVKAKDKNKFSNIIDGIESEADFRDSLLIFTKVLFQFYNKKPIILIDEYDVPVAKSHANGYYTEMIDLERSLLSKCLKSNPYLNFAILTGCLRITKESIFTGLNNLKCFDIPDDKYSDVFGFTQTEVDKLLAEAGCEERKETIREWYDGYRFGNQQEIYCPWSIMSYLEDVQDKGAQAEPKAYWVSTSANELPRNFVRLLPEEEDVRGKVAALLAGFPIAARINPEMNYVDALKDAGNFWTLLYLTGYLTKASDSELYDGDDMDEGDTLLTIPNREVRQVFQKEIESWLADILPGDANRTRKELYNALWDRNVPGLEKVLTEVLLGCSFHDDRESYYHGMVYGILRMGYRRTFSNGTSGPGRFDVVVEDSVKKRAAVLEFKRITPGKKKQEGVASQRAMSTGVRNALKQITDMKYDSILRADGYGTILHVGIAFCRNTVKVGFKVAPADE